MRMSLDDFYKMTFKEFFIIYNNIVEANQDKRFKGFSEEENEFFRKLDEKEKINANSSR